MKELKDSAKIILTKIHNMFENEPLYERIKMEDYTSLLNHLYKDLCDERDRGSTGLCKGKWVQVLEHQRKPFYAKVDDILDDVSVTLEGIYYSDNGTVTKRRYLKDFIIPVPRALARELEYCNDINIFNEEVLLNEN